MAEMSSCVPLAPCPTGLRPVEMLTSREVWVARGEGCQIAIRLLVNGERPEDESWRASVAERLGQVLRKAAVLSPISLF